LYYHAIRYLKFVQVRYQICYWVRSKWRKLIKHRYRLSFPSHPVSLKFINWIDKPETLVKDSFKFLNLVSQIDNYEIDWNFDCFGKLWNYYLNYMDYLLQPGMGQDRGKILIHDFIQKLTSKSCGLEPYPISVRGINWIKFLTKHGVQNQTIDSSLYAQYKILLDNLEYHLLGNHLLENSFSLLFGAFYFNDRGFYDKAKDIIENELIEQILDDGGHFELSPMYHQIILDRILDSINLLQNNILFGGQESLLDLLKAKSFKMLHWISCMTLSNGNIPLFNDSTFDIAPSTQQLDDYAIRLKLISENTIHELRLNSLNSSLKDSGYRRFNCSNYECIIDVGQIGPDYQPGHAHADTFNFELYLQRKPIVVDTGISTYEKNDRRQNERGTSAHNTIQFGNLNSSEIWNGFRVAKRAKIIHLQETGTEITAVHDGYKHLGLFHERIFAISDNGLKITDNIIGNNKLCFIARIHLHPDVEFREHENKITINGLIIEFLGYESIFLSDYLYSPQYNKLIPSKVIEISFYHQLNSIFRFN
jgi:hypothetical protein